MNQTFFAEYQPYIFIATGLLVLGFSVFSESGKSILKKTGVPVDGIIFEQDYSNNSGSTYTKDKISVRFVTQTLEWITGTIEQDFQTFYTGQYKNGETVKVYYDKDNPSNFYIDTKQSELIARIVIGLVGLLFSFIGIYGLL